VNGTFLIRIVWPSGSLPAKRCSPVQRILTGDKTVAEVSRALDIAPSVIRNWARRSEAGATTALAANEDVVPASQLREAYGPSGSSSGSGARSRSRSSRRRAGAVNRGAQHRPPRSPPGFRHW
jgi:transposase-like protein